MQVRLPHKHIPLTQPLRIPRLLVNLRAVLTGPARNARWLPARSAIPTEQGDQVRRDVVPHPVVAGGREMEAVIPVLLTVRGRESVVGDGGVEVEGVALCMLVGSRGADGGSGVVNEWERGMGGSLQVCRFVGKDAVVYFGALAGGPRHFRSSLRDRQREDLASPREGRVPGFL